MRIAEAEIRPARRNGRDSLVKGALGGMASGRKQRLEEAGVRQELGRAGGPFAHTNLEPFTN